MRKIKILLTVTLFIFFKAPCFGQRANFVKIENNGFSPPSLSATTIIETNNYYKIDMNIAFTFVVDSNTFNLLKKFVEQYTYLKSYASSDYEFGVLKISTGYKRDTTDYIKKVYFTESTIRSKFFLEDLAKTLTQNNCNLKFLNWVNNYLLKVIH